MLVSKLPCDVQASCGGLILGEKVNIQEMKNCLKSMSWMAGNYGLNNMMVEIAYLISKVEASQGNERKALEKKLAQRWKTFFGYFGVNRFCMRKRPHSNFNKANIVAVPASQRLYNEIKRLGLKVDMDVIEVIAILDKPLDDLVIKYKVAMTLKSWGAYKII